METYVITREEKTVESLCLTACYETRHRKQLPAYQAVCRQSARPDLYSKTQILTDHGHMVQQRSHDPDANRVKLHVLNYNDSNILLLLLQKGFKVTKTDTSATAD